MNFTELETERLFLRKVQKTDNEFVLKAYSNNELTKYMLHRYYTLEEVKEQMEYYANMYATNTGFAWVLQNKTTTEKIGIVTIFNYSILHKKGEMGFWVLPEYYKQGYTTEAVKTIIRHCFKQLNFNRIEATVETENIASINTIRKLGLQHEGTFREYEINNGQYIDLMMFSILKKEWKD